MSTITLMSGAQVHIREGNITMVSGTGGQSRVSGFGPAAMDVNEGAGTLLHRLNLTGGFAPLTAPNGVPLWIKREAVSLVRAPLGVENGNAILYVGGDHQSVTENVGAVLAAVGL
jgi:hypothetical protein